MPAYKVKIIDKIDEAEGTLSVRMEKPEDFEYIAGQHSVIKIDAPDIEPQDKAHTFSLSSSPTEDFLQITMRLSDSPFKQFMRSSELWTKLQVFAPVGGFVLPEERARPIVMIAGGIGIAPFRSMLVARANSEDFGSIVLLYSNTRLDRVVFKPELDSLQENIKSKNTTNNLKVVYTLTESAPADWTGETNIIDASFIQRYVGDLVKPIFYVCGPPDLVEAMEQILTKELSVAEGEIKDEKFIGY